MAYQNVASVLMFFPFVQLLLTQYPMRYGSVSCIINQLKIKGFYLVFSFGVFFSCRLYFIWTKEIENEWKRLEVRRNMYSVVDSGTGQMQSTQLTRKKTNRITSTTVCLVIPLLDSFARSVRSFVCSLVLSFVLLLGFDAKQTAKIILPWTRKSLDFLRYYISMAEQIDAHTSKITSLHLPNVFLLFIYERIIKC